MKRLMFIASLSVCCIVLAASGLAQQDAFNPQPAPYVTPLDPGSNLMLWSQMQEPQPTQQPPSERPVPLPDPQPEQKGSKNAPSQPNAQVPNAGQSGNEPSTPEAAQQTFTGTIVKSSGKYVLKMDNSAATYQLDDQEKAKQYEGSKVKVLGTLDAGSGLIHVQQIQTLS